MTPLEIKYKRVEKKTRGSKKRANTPEPKLEPLLWAGADKLRGHIYAGDYEHVLVALIFLKCISDVIYEYRKNFEAWIRDHAKKLYIDKSLDRSRRSIGNVWR